ncbi:MAG: hypothetical protein BGN88_10870 [Clostridiales bacterium 43-6]|nr:MAG: hypothetical protein BGN88_10870 [Clostridiales bacterium 43-6]
MLKLKLKHIFLVLLCFLVIFLIFYKNEASMKSAETGLMLCSSVIIPALFPFMVLSSFMIKSGVSNILSFVFTPFTKYLFGLPKSTGTAILMAFIGGYPVGAVSAYSLYKSGEITKTEAQKMLYFCVNSGPAFIVLAVGVGMLHSFRAGILLLVTHILASFLLGIFCNLFVKKEAKTKRERKTMPQANIMDAFVESTAESSQTILIICGFTVLFSSLIGVINSFPFAPAAKEILRSVLEVTNGCSFAASHFYLPLMAAILGFGGVSVHCQVFVAAREIRPSYLKFLFARLVCAAVSFIIIIPIESLFPVAKEVFSNDVKPMPVFLSYSLPSSVALLLMCVVFLFSIHAKNKKTPLDFFKHL